MLIVSTPNLENQKIKEYLGIVTGSTVRARNVGSDILANLKKSRWRRTDQLFSLA